MSLTYLNLLGAILPVFALFAAGYLVRRAHWLTAEADASVLRLCVNVFYPSLIFETLLNEETLRDFNKLFLPPLAGFALVAAGLLLAVGGAFLIRLRGRQARTFGFTTGIQNYGYIAIPIVQTCFDRSTVSTLFMHNLGVEIAFWTLGLLVLNGGSMRSNWKQAFNPPVIAILLSIVLNLLGARNWMPQIVMTTAHLFGQCAVPIAVLLSGAALADFLLETRPLGGVVVAAGACAIRLGLMPVLFLMVARYAPCSQELKRVLVVQGAMPAAMLPIVISKHYGGDEHVALQVVLATTLVSLFTIPLWIQVGLRLIGG